MRDNIITSVFLMAFLGIGITTAQECSNCMDFVVKLSQHLVKPEQVATASEMFKQKLCPGDDQCVKDVDELWPDMANAIFRFPDTPLDICSADKALCDIKVTDCNTCTTGLAGIKAVFDNDGFQKRVERLLIKDLFCSHVSDNDRCAAFVQKHASKAISVVGAALVAASVKNCQAALGTSCN